MTTTPTRMTAASIASWKCHDRQWSNRRLASVDKFSEYPLVKTTANGTEYSSAAEGGVAITNVGEKVIEVMDVSGCMSYMKVQMCEGLHGRKMLASVSRLNQAGHKLVFDTPDCGSYMECKTTGIRRWLRQENGVFDLDLWVKPVHLTGRVRFRSMESTKKTTYRWWRCGTS